MAVTMDRPRVVAASRWRAFLLAAALPLFLGALLGDWAYARSFEIQWSNFAAWLLAGGMVFAGIALVCAIVDLVRHRARALAGSVLLLALFVLGFIDSLVHARDAWAVMPTGIVLTAIACVLVVVATWLAFAGLRAGDVP
jgi:hypothetical protein